MGQMRKGLLAALAGAAALACAGQASAAIQTVNFTVDPGSWGVGASGTTPFGLSTNPTLTGSFSYDDTLSGIAAITQINYMTGTVSWSLADLAPSSWLVFSSPGVVDNFRFNLSNAMGEAIIDVGFNYQADFSDHVNVMSCHHCTESPQMAAPPILVPEPSTWAMMMLGVFGLGTLLRRRQQGALEA